eukprot:gene46299-57741_t
MEQFGSMTKLNLLQLARNFFTGTIPSILSNASTLGYLDLSVNYLTGTIPQSFGTLTNLSYIALFSNILTGQIKNSMMVELTQLRDLYVSYNALTGPLPSVFSRNMLVYELYTNSFIGTLPAELFELNQLNYFDIGSNYITGTMPDGFKSQNQVNHLAMNTNYMSGTLPATITNLTYVLDMLLYNNMFSGTLPYGMNRLHLLETLMLQGNQLSGNLYNLINATAPLWFDAQHNYSRNSTKFQVLNSIDVSSNRFTGTIPPQIFAL